MKEKEKDKKACEEHVFGIVKDEEGSYFPGCVNCQEPAFVVKEGQVEFKEKADNSPVG